MCTMGF